MSCCQPIVFQFSNVSTSTINYGVAFQNTYGSTPRLFVYYFDPDTGEFYLSPFFTVMTIDNNVITVDHGGPNSGFIVMT